MSVAPPTEQIVTCPGCGGRNPTGSNECDWCGRPFVSKGGRLRLTIWQLLTSLLLLGLIGAVAALAYLNQGRALPPVRANSATAIPASTFVPTPAVTPRVSAASAPTTTPAPLTSPSGPTPEPTSAQEPTVEPTPTPELQAARIVNTSGLGVSVRLQPGPQSPRQGCCARARGFCSQATTRPWRRGRGVRSRPKITT